jgi:hypothetical protein
MLGMVARLRFLFVAAATITTNAICSENPAGDAVIHGVTGGSEIVITTIARMAGAISSLTWNGREFIDCTDHGRELQSACSFDNTPQWGPETFNPTEAGSRRDGSGGRSTSLLLNLFSRNNELIARTQMAFWLAPGERSAGQLARNTNLLSSYTLAKHVSIGFDKWKQALDYRVTFTIPAGTHHTNAQFEALTGYMPAEFERFWQFDPTGRLVPLSDGPGEIDRPVVLATDSGSHAMGISAPLQGTHNSTGVRYGRWRFKTEHVVKWNCVFRFKDPNGLAAGDYSFQMRVTIGSLADVERMLRDWSQRDNGGGPRGTLR